MLNTSPWPGRNANSPSRSGPAMAPQVSLIVLSVLSRRPYNDSPGTSAAPPMRSSRPLPGSTPRYSASDAPTIAPLSSTAAGSHAVEPPEPIVDAVDRDLVGLARRALSNEDALDRDDCAAGPVPVRIGQRRTRSPTPRGRSGRQQRRSRSRQFARPQGPAGSFAPTGRPAGRLPAPRQPSRRRPPRRGSSASSAAGCAGSVEPSPHRAFKRASLSRYRVPMRPARSRLWVTTMRIARWRLCKSRRSAVTTSAAA